MNVIKHEYYGYRVCVVIISLIVLYRRIKVKPGIRYFLIDCNSKDMAVIRFLFRAFKIII